MNTKYEVYDVEADMYKCNEYFPNTIAFTLKWVSNLGFGELTFLYNIRDREWAYDTECMDKEFCLAVLNKWLSNMWTSNNKQ